MDSNQLEGQWKQIRGELQRWWGRLTDDDIDQIAGNKDKLVGAVQQKYGYLYEEAQQEIDRRLDEFETSHSGLGSRLKDKARNVTSSVGETFGGLKAGTEEMMNAVASNESFRNLRTDLVQIIRRYPVQSLLFGLVLGFFLARRSDR